MFGVLMKRAAQLSIALIAISSLEGGLFAAGPFPSSSPPEPVASGARSVFLNGIDVSSARNQDLRNVHVKISDNGDIQITAPQYQVTEEETFLPLSSYSSKPPMPEHRPPQAMAAPKSPLEESERTSAKSPKEAPSAPAESVGKPSLPAQPASAKPPKSGG